MWVANRPEDAEFREFFYSRGPVLLRAAYVIVGDWQLAEDITQQALTRVHAAWRRNRPESLEAYARRAVINEAVSSARRRRREWPTPQIPDDSIPEHVDAGLDVDRALELLAPQQRAIVALRFLEDMSVAQVAVTLGVAEGTVKSQTSRALAILRVNLPELVFAEEPK